MTGWRIHSEVLNLHWRQVDLRPGTVRLDAEKTKNREGVFKFKAGGELDALLHAQEASTQAAQRDRHMVSPWVFHRAGKPIKNFYRAWRTACLTAGLGYKAADGRTVALRIVHDLRRTAVRNLVRAGIPERVAMQMTGHKTRNVFERYNITSEGAISTGSPISRGATQSRAPAVGSRAQFGHNRCAAGDQRALCSSQ